MTVSGSKVEVTEDLSETIQQRQGRPHSRPSRSTPTPTTCCVTQIDIGEAEPVQICHRRVERPLRAISSPRPCTIPLLPGGVKINEGQAARRGVRRYARARSRSLTCDLHDFPYAEIKPAAILERLPSDRSRQSPPSPPTSRPETRFSAASSRQRRSTCRTRVTACGRSRSTSAKPRPIP